MFSSNLCFTSLVDKHGEHASNAHQFRDIGFMSHTSDKASYTIELLQHEFEQNFSWQKTDEQRAGKVVVLSI